MSPRKPRLGIEAVATAACALDNARGLSVFKSMVSPLRAAPVQPALDYNVPTQSK